MLIKTIRTVIKPFSISDLPNLYDLCSSAQVMKFMPPRFSAETILDTKKRLNNYLGHYKKHGYSFYKVIAVGNKFIGRAAFYNIEDTEDIELGFSLVENF